MGRNDADKSVEPAFIGGCPALMEVDGTDEQTEPFIIGPALGDQHKVMHHSRDRLDAIHLEQLADAVGRVSRQGRLQQRHRSQNAALVAQDRNAGGVRQRRNHW